MGGKTKQSQRTKNNVRPSSSSRSAEVLNSGVTLDSGLVNLGTGKPLSAIFPTLAATNLEQGLNPEFQMCIKKLNKKDPITKTKALQELCELVKNSDVEDIVAALPSWAHFYKILTSDTDRKVREMTQACHGAIVRACGRRMAPQLKALLPAWLQAQYDEHAPAQTQASLSLTSTFPDSKLPEVISFCKAEVISHLLDNLIGNAEAIVTKKIENPEERELQLNRIITSSLQGLEYFTLNLPAVHDDWLWSELTPLLQSKAFWKFSSGTPQVRGAWYGATGRVGERYGRTFGAAHGARALRLLLQAAGEHNAPLAAQLWTCLLQLMHNIPDWHTYIDKKDLLVKRILDVLENGGWGDARHLSNVLLPLLAYLPKEILTKDFYESFFKAVFDGLYKKNILNSKSERQSWITSLAECLRYLSIQQNDFVLEIATSVHRTWLEKVLCTLHDPQTRNNLIKCSATQMTSLIKYWLKQSKEENSEKYDQLVRNFWQNVGSTVLTQIDKSSTDQQEICQLIDGHILLLQTLKTTFGQEAKKQQSIKFSGDEQSVPEKCAVMTQQCDPSILDRYKHNLEELVQNICFHYLENAKRKEISSAILTPLITLLIEFDSQNLFIAIARQFQAESVYRFYEKVLRPWLSEDTMRCKAVVDILFLLMKYMSEEEQDSMFETFKQFPPAVVEWCISVCVCHPHVQAGPVRRWLRGQLAASTRRALAARAARHADGAAARLLRASLRDAPDGEPLVCERGVSDVLKTLSEAISEANNDNLEASAALAAQLVTMLQEHSASQNYAQLVQELFRLNIHVPRGDSRLSVDTWCEVRSSWQDGVSALPEAARNDFLKKASAFLHEQLFQDMDNLNITKIVDIVSPCPYLLNRRYDAGGPDDVSEVVAFTKLLFDMEDPEALFVESCALRHECVTSQLNCVFEDDNEAIQMVVRESARSDLKELTKTDLILFVNKYLFRAMYLRAVLVHKINSDDDEEEEPSKQNTWCNVLLKDDYIKNEYYKVLYNYVIILSLHEGYAFWPHHDLIRQTKETVTNLIQDVSNATSQELITQNATALSELALAKGYFWAFARNLFEEGSEQQKLFDDHKLQDIVSGNGFCHSLQAVTKRSPEDNRAHLMRLVVMLRSWHALGLLPAAGLRPLASRGDADLDLVVNAYYRQNHTMLYETDISDAPWSKVVSNVAVVEFLTDMVARNGWDMPAHHWDFTTITLCSLLSSVEKSKRNWGSTKVSMLARAVLRLFAGVRRFVAALPAECLRRQPAPHVAALLAEWRDIFAPDTHGNLLTVLVHVLDSCTEREMTSNQKEVVSELITCAALIEWDLLPAAHKLGRLSLARLAGRAAAALQQAAHLAYKHLAYGLLVALAKPLVLDDAEKLSLWSEDSLGDGDEEKERPQFALDLFHDAFTNLQETVEEALCCVMVGAQTCSLEPPDASHTLARGWLLLAELLAQLCRLARGDLVHHYIQIYRQRQYAEPLVRAALRLVPRDVFAAAAGNASQGSPQHTEMFLNLAEFSVHQAARAGDLGALACRCVYSAVCGAGCGGVRGWWSAAAAKEARLLERLVQLYVTPHAANEQLTNLHQRAGEIEDTEVRISWSSKEVTCIYNVEERYIELHVWLARAHPLTAPRLQAPDSIGPGGNTHWVAMYLAYQNGTILNALKMWTRAVSSKVEASPQCYICYCRLHPTTGRLPRVTCHQCKNKFHNLCLRKWFTTSNKSSCPLCRTNF